MLPGPVGIRVDGADLPLGGPKQRAVFAMLALNARRVVSLDRLIDALWNDEPPSRATLTLQSYISRLRRTLTDARAGDDEAPQILSRPPGWVLTLAPAAPAGSPRRWPQPPRYAAHWPRNSDWTRRPN